MGPSTAPPANSRSPLPTPCVSRPAPSVPEADRITPCPVPEARWRFCGTVLASAWTKPALPSGPVPALCSAPSSSPEPFDERPCRSDRVDRRRTAHLVPRPGLTAAPRCASSTATTSRITALRLPTPSSFPESTEEVARIVSLCARHRCPVIPFGTGTVARRARPGACTAGVSIDMTRMNDVLEVNADDLDCRIPARGEAQAAQRVPARHRPVLPHRPGRRCIARRDDRDPRIGHERGCATARCGRTCWG